MIDVLIDYRALLQYFLIFGTTIWAFQCGAGPERWMGAILSAAVIIFNVLTVALMDAREYATVIVPYLAIDSLLFVALVPLAMRANRIYPICILAAQLISLAMHFQRALLPAIEPGAYFVLTHGPSWIQAIAFVSGMIMHRSRTKRFGPYRAWKTSSAR